MTREHDPDDLPDRLLRAALKYAKRGYRVHPLRPGSKIPLLPEWQTEATTDPEAIATWWSQWPRANVGIATGAGSDLFVLDVDLGHGKQAAKSMKRLRKKYGDLPPTYTVRTPSGGLHHYFRMPKGAEGETWRNSAGYVRKDGEVVPGPLGAGVDVRAEGGQVAAPPSVLSDGSTYKRTVGNPRADLPAWLAALTKHVPPKVPERPSIDPATLGQADRDRLGRYVVSAVDAVAGELRELGNLATDDPQAYKGPPWNETTFKAACRLLELGQAPWSNITVSDAFDVLMENAPRDRHFTDRTVELIWRSATKRIGDKVLPVPEAVVGPYLIPRGDDDDDRAQRSDPDLFFQKGEGLLAERLAFTLLDDLAVGLDHQFWKYDAGVWKRDKNALLQRVTFALGDRYRPAHYSAVRDLVIASGRLPYLSADPLPDLVNTRSGMVDWRTGALLPHDPAYLSTVQLPVDWEPLAECPNFDAWLQQVIPAEVIELVWEVIGYLAMSGNPLQVAILLHGGGGNGKGTLLRVILRMLGRWNTSAVTLRSISEGKFEVAEMLGKVANIAGDIDSKHLKDTSRFKALTGEDMVEAQRKHQDPFFFVNWAVPVFSANELWRSSDVTQGYFDRWVTIPFPNRVRRTGNFDEATLHAELPGILAKGVRSLQRLMTRGKFVMTGAAADLQAKFAEESDLLRLWIREDDHVLHAEAGPHGYGVPKASRAVLYRTFRDWARDSGHGELSSTSFYDRLRSAGFYEGRDSRGRYFYGIRLDIADSSLVADQPPIVPHAIVAPGDFGVDD